jgi:hypothetical protein
MRIQQSADTIRCRMESENIFPGMSLFKCGVYAKREYALMHRFRMQLPMLQQYVPGLFLRRRKTESLQYPQDSFFIRDYWFFAKFTLIL